MATNYVHIAQFNGQFSKFHFLLLLSSVWSNCSPSILKHIFHMASLTSVFGFPPFSLVTFSQVSQNTIIWGFYVSAFPLNDDIHFYGFRYQIHNPEICISSPSFWISRWNPESYIQSLINIQYSFWGLMSISKLIGQKSNFLFSDPSKTSHTLVPMSVNDRSILLATWVPLLFLITLYNSHILCPENA